MQSFVISHHTLSDIHFVIDSNNLQINQNGEELIIDLDNVSRFFDAIEHETSEQSFNIKDIDLQFNHLDDSVEIRDYKNPKGCQFVIISKSNLNEILGNISDCGL